jgi:hypothetical protein
MSMRISSPFVIPGYDHPTCFLEVHWDNHRGLIVHQGLYGMPNALGVHSDILLLHCMGTVHDAYGPSRLPER